MSRRPAGQNPDKTAHGRRPLTRTRIARAALRLIDRQGLEAFSLRGLAARLGVEPMSLYYHLPNKEAVLDAVMEEMAGEVRVACDGPWVDQLRQAAWSYREMAMRHPGAFRLMLIRPYRTERLLRFCDDLLAIFQGAGLAPRTAALLFRLLGHWLDGATLYTAEGPARKGKVPAPVPVDPQRFPALAAIGPHLGRQLAEAHFAWGLEHLLAEVARQARGLDQDSQP